uniref:SAP domain-containing protein n=1 Tax=Moniliophthora roreri TaxID=221103 RepID=A0A0W0G2C4_MONRR
MSSLPNNITFFTLHKCSVANHMTNRPIVTATAQNDPSEFSKRFTASTLTAIVFDIAKSSVVSLTRKLLLISVVFLLMTRLSIYLLGELASVHLRMSRGAASVPPELLSKKFQLPSLGNKGNEPEEYHLYQLTKSGNKADLLKRLLDLSENWDNWKLFKPVVKCTHKGEQPGSKSKKCAWRHSQEDTWTRAEIEEQLALAREILAEHPEYSKPFWPPATKASTKQTLSTQINSLEAKVDWLVVSQLQQTANLPPLLPTTSISNLSTPALDAAISVSPDQHLPLSNPSAAATTIHCSNPSPAMPFPQVPVGNPGSGTTTPNDIPRMRSFILFNGTVVTFDQTKVPDPPKHTFSRDLDELSILWSDDHPKFKENKDKCIVKINDHCIAYEYWPDVFKHKVKECKDQ